MGGLEEDMEAEVCYLYEEDKLSRVKVARQPRRSR